MFDGKEHFSAVLDPAGDIQRSCAKYCVVILSPFTDTRRWPSAVQNDPERVSQLLVGSHQSLPKWPKCLHGDRLLWNCIVPPNASAFQRKCEGEEGSRSPNATPLQRKCLCEEKVDYLLNCIVHPNANAWQKNRGETRKWVNEMLWRHLMCGWYEGVSLRDGSVVETKKSFRKWSVMWASWTFEPVVTSTNGGQFWSTQLWSIWLDRT